MLRPLFWRSRPLLCFVLVLPLATSCGRKSRADVAAEGSEALPAPDAADAPVERNDPVPQRQGQHPDPKQEGEASPPRPQPETDHHTGAKVEVISASTLLERIRSSGSKGTLVNAWASWCGPCRREFPMLVALKDSLSAQKIDVVFVSVDEPETYGAAVDFATTRGIAPPIVVAERPLGPFKRALSPKWPGMLPATFLIDGDGRLRYFWGGPVYEEELLPIVGDFLDGKEVDGYAKVPLQRGKDFRLD